MAEQSMERKQKIRDRYKGIDPSRLEVIPAKESASLDVTDRTLRVAAYIRVSTDNDEQTSSFELQQNEYTDQINANPRWELAGIYSDEGISGTELSHRTGMLRMIEDAKAGKIDLILTKSIARFARNIVDCLSVIETLKNLDPPVGVKFETDNIYTLDSAGRMILTILASVAEEESHSKSLIMNWSIDKRFSRGLFLTPKLLGYDLDENGNLIVNQEEAETVKVIYALYLNGWSSADIADLLTDYGRKTKLGNEVWYSTSVNQIIENERHCGDVLARKTYTPNFLTHKPKKNCNNRTQYRQRDHHEAIVSREVFDAANLIRSSRAYSQSNRPLPVLSVIDDGILRGFIPIDKDWQGFSAEEYQTACESVSMEEQTESPKGKRLDLEGYQNVRGTFFSSARKPSMTIAGGKMRFNTTCLRLFESVEYVELLLNTVKKCIAIRPCTKENPNAIRWGRLREERWSVSTFSCKGLARTLFGIMNWEDDSRYQFRGQIIKNNEEKLLLFELEEPVVIRKVTRVLGSSDSDASSEEGLENSTEQAEELVLTETVKVYPPSWAESFGRPLTSLDSVSLLNQVHYAGDWDVLRPARELEEMNIFTADSLANLMEEAETIMEGWVKHNESQLGK